MNQFTSIELLSKENIAGLIRPRLPDSHKGHYGHALLRAGSHGKMGAAVLCARACLRSGAGLLTVHCPGEEGAILQTAIPEAMLQSGETGDGLERFAAIGMGPGMGFSKENEKLVKLILREYKGPLLLDADALTMVSKTKKGCSQLPPGTVITPHPGEFDRLFGPHRDQEERVSKAIQLSLEFPIVIVLKYYRTLIAWNGEGWLNTTGNAGLAKGGSGDVLAGMITALLAQGYDPLKAAWIGVYLHGLAADLAIKEQSMESLLASDVIESIGQAFTATIS